MHSLTDLGRYSRQNYLGGQAMSRCVGRYVSAGSLVLLCRSVPGRAAARVPFETPWPGGGLAGTSKGPAALAGWLNWGCQREVIAITIQHIVINLDFLHPPRLVAFVTDPRHSP